MTTKVLFNGKKAIGVEFIRQLDFPASDYIDSSTREKLYCEEAVILAGGAINTPQLLMLSGVGPGQHLKDYSIPVVQDMPGVGSNLQDHLEIYVQQVCQSCMQYIGGCRLANYRSRCTIKVLGSSRTIWSAPDCNGLLIRPGLQQAAIWNREVLRDQLTRFEFMDLMFKLCFFRSIIPTFSSTFWYVYSQF
jgi:hypothetical protein